MRQMWFIFLHKSVTKVGDVGEWYTPCTHTHTHKPFVCFLLYGSDFQDEDGDGKRCDGA